MTPFFAPGIPAPGGSKKGFAYRDKKGNTRVAISDAAGQRNKDWRATVALAASEHFAAPLAGPVASEFIFVLPRPRDHFGSGRNASTLKPSAPEHHTKAPDALKLARSTEDALKGIAWGDDCQVVSLVCRKEYGERPGAYISICPVLPKEIAAPQSRSDVRSPLPAMTPGSSTDAAVSGDLFGGKSDG